MEKANLLNILLTSGLLGTIISLFFKWRHDRKKIPLEREAVLSTASTQNVTDALAISAEARATAQAVREQYKEDAERAKTRHEWEMAELRERSAEDLADLRERLDTLEDSNDRLTRKVTRLERDDRLNRARIGKLENSLTAAKDTVVHLDQYIRNNTTQTGPIPEVDYTIFDIDG